MNLDFKSVISNEDYDDAPIAEEEAVLAADVAEVDEISDEIATDNDQIDDFSEELDETIEDVQELESTQADLEEALGDDDYEGMDQVAVEQLNRRLARVAAKRGFDISATRGVFSKESFTGTASNRRRATEYALEGLVDTIKQMWERIKAAVKAMWEGIKKFWKEHLSTMGRLIKALKKVKQRIKDAKGNPDGTVSPKAAGSLSKVFPGKENLSAKTIADFTGRQVDFVSGVTMFVDNINASANKIATTIKSGNDVAGEIALVTSTLTKGKAKESFGSESAPLVGGVYGEITGDNTEGDSVKVELQWKEVKVDAKDRKLTISGKNELGSMIDSNISLIEDTEKLGGRFQKLQVEFDKAQNAINSAVAGMSSSDDEDDLAKAVRVASRSYQDLMRLVPKINSRAVKLNIRCAQGAVSYAKTCLSNYKA